MGIISTIAGDRRAGDYNLKNEKYSEAIEYYDRALRKDPNDYKSLKGKGWALIGLEEYGTAFNYFNNALNVNPISEDAKKGKISALLGLGNEDIKKDNFVSALNFFEEVLNINHPNASDFEVNGHYDKAKEILLGKTSTMFSGHLDEFIGIKFGDADALTGKGNAFYGMKDLEGALDCFDRVLRIQPEHIDALTGKAYTLDALEDYLGSIKCYELVLNEEPNNYPALTGKGWALIELKKWKLALICFNRALTMEESDEYAEKGKIKASLALGDLNIKDGKFEAAFNYYEEVLGVEPENSWALIGKIDSLIPINNELLNRKEFNNALESSNNAIKSAEILLNSDDISMENLYYIKELRKEFTNLKYPALIGKGRTSLDNSDFQEALNSFKDALKIKPHDEEAEYGELKSLLGLGRNALERKEFDEAIKYYTKAANISGDNEEVLNGMFSAILGNGNHLLKAGNFLEALQSFDNCLKIKPEDFNAKYGAGLAMNGLERYEEALNYFNNISKTNDKDSKVLRGKALALEGTKNFQAARLIFDQILDENPDDIISWKGKARILLELKDFKNAVECFDEVLKYDQSHDVKVGKINALEGLGKDLLDREEFEEALKNIEEALRCCESLETGKSEISGNLSNMKIKALKSKGDRYFISMDFKSSVKCYDEILSIKLDLNVLSCKGMALNNLKDFNNAINCFEEVLNVETNNILALKGSAEAFTETYNFDEALNVINKALNLELNDEDKDKLLKLKVTSFIGIGKNSFNWKDLSTEGMNLQNSSGNTEFFDSDYVKSINWGFALKNFENALDIQPDNLEALNGKKICLIGEGYSFLKSHNFTDARNCFEDVTKNEEELIALRGKGLALNGLNNFGNALEIFNQVLKVHPKDIIILESKCQALLNLKKLEGAFQCFDEILIIDEKNSNAKEGKIEVLWQLGTSKLNSKEFKPAINYFNQLLEMDNNNLNVLLYKGDAHNNLKEYKTSIKCFDRVLELEKGNPEALKGKMEALISKGTSLLSSNDLSGADQAFSNVLEIDTNNERGLKGKLNILKLQISSDLAIKSFKDALDRIEKFFEYNARLNSSNTADTEEILKFKLKALIGRANEIKDVKPLEIENLDTALRYLEEALSLEKNNQDVKNGIVLVLGSKGKILYESQDFESAFECFDKTLKLDPNNSTALWGRTETLTLKGYHLQENGDPSEALECFEEVLSTDPKNLGALTGKGLILNEFSKFDSALNSFNEALNINEQNKKALNGKIDALLGLSNVKLRENNVNEAKDCFDQVLRVSQDNVEALRGKGLILNKLQEFEKAGELFNKALKINPQDQGSIAGQTEACNCLGYILLDKEDFSAALKNFEDNLKNNPDNPKAIKGKTNALIGIANQYLASENFEHAQEYFRKALEINKNDYRALNGTINSLCSVAEFLFKSNEYEEALEKYGEALKIDPESYKAKNGKLRTLSTYGDMLLLQKDPLNAQKCFEDALKIDPANKTAKMGKLTCSLKIGCKLLSDEDYEGSLKFFNDVLSIDPENETALTGTLLSSCNHGKELLKEKKYLEALKSFENALEIEDTDMEALHGKFKSAYACGRYDDALECLERVQRINPHDEILLEKEKLLYKAEKWDEIIPYADQRLEEDPTNLSMHILKGKTLMQKKDYGKALKCFEDGMLCHPESQEALQGIIEVLIELKDLETAMECIDTLLKINPKNEVGLYNKNKVLKLLKKKETNKDLNTAKPLETSFSHNKGILKKISQINFGLMSPENIRKMSVTKIVTTDTYDEDGYPIEAGLMDPRLGVIDPGLRCRSCGSNGGECPGHFGHINLARPVIHVGFADIIHKVLRSTCSECGRVLLTETEKIDYKNKIENHIAHAEDITPIIKEIYNVARRDKCPHCDAEQEDIKIQKPVSIIEGNYKLTASEVRERLENIPEEDYVYVGINSEVARPEWMVLTVLPVPPVTMRPPITLKTGERSEDDLTHKLVDILRINQRLKENMEAGAPQIIVEDLWELLQYHVTTYFDNEATDVPPARHRSGRPLKTLAQRLKGKEGRFRSNLSGKRVNFSARTVISPDPNISINEIGVPEMIAKEVTVPVHVTEWNMNKMKEYIMNGPNKHHGANYIIRPDGNKIRVYDETKETVADKLEEGFIVERHLMDGDVVLFNRQPSLHRMSMMAHEVKVLPYKTFRLNPCVCPPYNADFDGDEMNLHVLQTEEARAEVKSLMRVQEHILSPRFGGPIIGGIHDHISGAYLLTRLGSNFSEEDVFQMAKKAGIPLPEPKNKKWTGKEIFSLLLPEDLNMVYKAEICRKCDECLKESCKNDAYVVIEDGKLKLGAIDERAYGAFAGKILDSIVKEYGTDAARQFLDSSTKLAISVITKNGFTTSTADEEIPQEAKDRIEELLKKAEEKVERLIKEYHSEELEALPGRSLRETLEMKIMQVLGEARDSTGVIAENYFGMENSEVIMARTGASGSMLNLTQIAACVGQQSVRGGRIERGYSKRTLPHFHEGEMGAKASGFVHSSYKKGLDPLEFFFHAMGGREGLVDTEVRTAQSGYMQRRLVNALQDLSVKPDGTVRDNNGKIIQILYGEDGIDPAKSDYGKVADIDGIIENMRLKSEELPKKSKENSLSSIPVIKSKKIKVHQRPTNNPVKSTQTISKFGRIKGLDPVIQNVSPKGKVPAEFKIKLNGKTYDYYSLGYYQPKNSFGNRQNLFSKDILKFKGEKRMDYMPVSTRFSEELIRLIERENLKFDMIIPIPRSSAGQIANGSTRLSSYVSEILRIEDGTGILKRMNSVKTSHLSNNRPSLQEHYNSISCSDRVFNKRILLFDDILTHGNTAGACIYKIHENNPSDITVLTLGRTV